MSARPLRGLPFLERCLRAAVPAEERRSGVAAEAEARRASVRRELAALFNAAALSRVEALEPYPQVRASTLAYGLPDLSGKTASSIDRAVLEPALL